MAELEQELRNLRNDINRKDKIIVRLGMVFLILLVIVVASLSFQVRHVKNEVQLIQQATSVTPLDGKDGLQGAAGLPGISGIDGANGTPGPAVKDSTSTVKEQPVYTNVPTAGPQGETGSQGEPGAPGREVELSKDSAGTLLWRYIGDTIWQSLDTTP